MEIYTIKWIASANANERGPDGDKVQVRDTIPN